MSAREASLWLMVLGSFGGGLIGAIAQAVGVGLVA